MTLGPGKYDDLATLVRERSQASAVVVIVFDGTKGDGFSVQSTLGLLTRYLPETLRAVADEIEQHGEQAQ